MTVTLLALSMAYAVDQQLAEDSRLAMKRADLTLDWVCRAIGDGPDKPYAMNKLSEQLSGKRPFTAFWRFFVGEMAQTDFRAAFFEIQAERIDALFLRRSRAVDLLARMDFLLGSPKPMAKASYAPQGQKEQAS